MEKILIKIDSLGGRVGDTSKMSSVIINTNKPIIVENNILPSICKFNIK